MKSLANGVAKASSSVTKAANKVTATAKKVEKVATQTAKKYDKIAADSLSDAKVNFASAAKDFNEAAKEVKQKATCVVNKAVDYTKKAVSSAVEYCKQNPLEVIHGALDVIGMIPALGNIADGLNAAIYLAQGDLANAALSAVSLIPMAGAVAALGKIVSKSDGLVKGALKYGDDIAEGIAKYGDDVASALAKNSDEAADALSGISKYDDKVDDIVEQCTDGVHCFVAGTLVLTTDGYKEIQDVEKGDKVIATDPETGETAIKEVVETYVNETDELIHLRVNGEEIITTPTHMFFAPQKGWTQAIDLRAGDILVLVNGEYVIVEETQHEILEEPVKVYNFEVADFHTYYVGEQSVLVHNKCGGDTYDGVKQASEYLKSQGVPRKQRKQILESFNVETIKLETAGDSTYGLRFYDGVNAEEKGRYLFETFTPLTNRENLALPYEWNIMTGVKQFQIKSGATMITGTAAPQTSYGSQYVGGALQWFISNLEDLIEC